MNLCDVVPCGKLSKSHGLCNMHNERRRKHGDVYSTSMKIYSRCSLPNCESKAKWAGLCGMHDYRLRANGDPNVTQRQYGAKRRISDQGYVMIWQPEHPEAMSIGYVYEHRKALHDLGVSLEGLQVHHIDHDKQNNDASNLVALTASEHASIHALVGAK